MNINKKAASMLQPYRILDLTNENGFLCGKILGDLGADVVKIEKPGGDPSRNLGPFYKDIPNPEKSLNWFAFNINKRGITLNIETKTGQELFKKLIATADFVVESFAPGYMHSLGLGYEDLSKIKPEIIVASITPFGQSGPYKNYVASDIVIQAMSGLSYVSGDPDRPPVRISTPQACLFAGVEAAIGTLMALNYRHVTGEGQHVDITMQRSMYHTMFDVMFWWAGLEVIARRQGSTKSRAKIVSQQMWPCKDGYVHFYFFAGPWSTKANEALVKWMDSEGFAGDYLKQINWTKFDWAKLTQGEVDQMEEPARKFFSNHTKVELYKGALRRHIMLYPVNTVEDILKDEQLLARDFWVELEHDELDTKITYPGPWGNSTETPILLKHRAPTIGEHNLEIYREELGLSDKELAALKVNGII